MITLQRLAICFLCAVLCLACSTTRKLDTYQSETLQIAPLSPHTFVHITYLNSPDFGKVACNGLLFAQNGEAVVFDTPVDDATARELIAWVEKELNCTIKAVVINHFHDDCLGGLQAFHDHGVPSYANQLTRDFAEKRQTIVPQIGFQEELQLTIGGKKVVSSYFGEAHTRDNIVSYLPGDKVLFGGCMVKALGANKGNVADANLDEWSNTVARIKAEYPHVRWVVPGHGKPGGGELLDYTIGLFN